MGRRGRREREGVGVGGVLVGEWRGVLGVFFVQAEDGIRGLVRSRGLGDVYRRQVRHWATAAGHTCPVGP